MSSKRAAPQSRSKAKSGGGIDSNKRREVGYKGGKRTLDAVSVQAVSELGAQTAYKKAPLVKATPNDRVALGNTLAASCPQGPGGGRTVYASGYQDQHGAAAKGEPGMQGSKVDRGPRAILGEAPNHNSPFHPVPFRKGQQINE
jgi:cytochrome c5